MVSTSVTLALNAGVLESVTVKVSETPDTADLGVPLIVPVAESNDSPAGNVPLVSLQV